jgi:hypothetical protein
MEAAETIRHAVARVGALRAAQERQPGLREAVVAIKALQGRRFAGTYADMFAGGPYAAAARFFLVELYSDRDFAERDAQFARIAGAIEKFFPAIVVQTSVNLAQLHALTEDLDHAMAMEWLSQDAQLPAPRRYVAAWRIVGRRDDRVSQLREVLAIGEEMARLTRTPGLRMMLKMMRGPAAAAGLSALQRFLENGFDTFAAMARGGYAPAFLRTIEQRESALIASLFDAPAVACETELVRTLGQAP